MAFHDHFSRQAAAYREGRPCYPLPLFQYLAEIVPERKIAWDCATGNGQVAVTLAAYMQAVLATDASANQLAHAEAHERVIYRQATAEDVGLADRSMDLITVAQALHWLDMPVFFAEAARILKPGGILAVWTYGLLSVEPRIDACLRHFYEEVVGPWWPPERRLVETRYAGIALPYPELEAPTFPMTADWGLEQVLLYLRSWSATQRYIADRGADPVESLTDELAPLWGQRLQTVSWPLTVRLCRRPEAS